MKLDVLAIGSHPDDVELGCGGTVALLAALRSCVPYRACRTVPPTSLTATVLG